MKLSTLTIDQLKLEMALHDPKGSIYRAALKELESRYQQPPDLSNEPAMQEILVALQYKSGK